MRRRSADPWRGQRGVTLVELMVALVVQSIFILFVLSLYTRMSTAYRAQGSVSDVQQTLQAARETVLPQLEQAGFGLPNGFKALGDGATVIPALSVINDADGTGPDLLRFYYADPTAQARVTSFIDANRQEAVVDFTGNFRVGDLVVMVNPRMIPVTGAADIAQYDACVARVTAIDASTNTIRFDGSSPDYNTGSNDQCIDVQDATQTEGPAASETMLYLFVGRSYRIDPARKELSVLQMSPSGELQPGDWTDVGIGFTDLQVATRYFEEGDTVDLDGDGDPQRDWYSAEAQETPDPTGSRPLNAVLTQVSVSFAVRTTYELDVVSSAQTPGFVVGTDPQSVAHNRIGDHPSLPLAGVPDSSRPPEHRGDHIYRFSTSTVNVRNMGVGR